MFRAALAIASEFTFPIVISRKTVAGDCSSSIGTFVVINDAGWIVTAGHILSKWSQLLQGAEATQAAIKLQKEIREDATLSKKEKAQRLAAGPVVGKNDSDRCSLWIPFAAQLVDTRYIEANVPEVGEVIDLGVGRIEPFDPAWVKVYPVFKDPTKGFDPGASLCKLGFPFHQFKPTWDAAADKFTLPPGALPMPRFPIEGIFTRVSEVGFEGPDQPAYPVKYVETSSPGLLGQSGGPTFDTLGSIWAIQAKTAHLPLGFSGQNQYLNVGLGVHPETMFPLFDQLGISYKVSDY